MRTPDAAVRSILEDTHEGIYPEPRGDQSKQHDPKYKVIWLPGDSYDQALHKCRTCAKAINLVRLRSKYRVRMLREDEADVWAHLRPGVDFVSLHVVKIFEICPVPHGTQRPAIVQLGNGRLDPFSQAEVLSVT